MIGTRLGEYEMVSRLGAGAMGTVWLGEREDGSRAALKVLHPHLVEEPGFFRRFEREASVGLSVQHDNVVSVLDYEMFMVDGKPTCCVVMEYVEGRTLRELLRDLGRVPEALLREIVAQIAAGLAAIHEQGVVHRDIKPDNVLITDDHRVRIMDLGVAKVLDASMELTARGAFAGTLAYAAPEQLRGEEVTHSCDLYALGVTLYELATGDNPFQHDDAAAAIAAHMNTTPPRITERNEEASAFLAELTATLLSKAPSARIASAADVSALLAEAESSSWWSEREPEATRIVHLRTLVPVRRDTRLQGRETELAALRDAFERAKRGAGNTVLVTGEAGLGKSRLVDEFVGSLDGEDVRVLYGSYSPSGGAGALSAAVLGAFRRNGLAEQLRPLIVECPGLAPALAAHLLHEAPPEGVDRLTVEALHTVFCRLAQGLAADRPTVWVVEDLHFGSEDAHKLVLSLARALAAHRFLLLATTRPGLPDEGVEHFGRLENLQRLTLGRLSPRDVIELLRDAFKSEHLADKLGAKIAYKSDGVPFFVFEMIRGLVEGQFISQTDDGTWVETKVVDDIEVPSAVRDLLTVRLSDLDDDDRMFLDVAAVDGFAFDPDLVSRVLDVPRIRVLQRLAIIERRHGLVRGDSDCVRFDHHLVREILYESVPPALREEYHAELARVLEARAGVDASEPGAPDGDLAVRLCEHYCSGRRARRARRYALAAVTRLQQGFLHERAVQLADGMLTVENCLDVSQRVAMLISVCTSLSAMGRAERHEKDAREALALAADSGDAIAHSRAANQLAHVLLKTGRYAEAQGALEEARSAIDMQSMREAAATIALNLGSVALYRGDLDQAAERFREVQRNAREAGDRQRESAAVGNLAHVFATQGRLDAARQCVEQQLALSRALADRESEATALNTLGVLALDDMRLGDAEALQRQHLELTRVTGDRGRQATALGNLGNVHRLAGRLSQARSAYARQLELCREIRDRRGELHANGNLALLLQTMGLLEDSRQHTETALELSRAIGDRASETTATGNLSDVMYLLGNADAARLHNARHLELARDVGLREAEALALNTRALIARADGDLDASLSSEMSCVAIARESGFTRIEVGAQVVVGAILVAQLRRGRSTEREAREALVAAEQRALEVGAADFVLQARCELASLPDGDVQVAAAEFDARRTGLDLRTRLELTLALWLATHDMERLVDAKRQLDQMLSLVADEHHASMLTNVRIHREIMEAWRAEFGDRDVDEVPSP